MIPPQYQLHSSRTRILGEESSIASALTIKKNNKGGPTRRRHSYRSRPFARAIPKTIAEDFEEDTVATRDSESMSSMHEIHLRGGPVPRPKRQPQQHCSVYHRRSESSLRQDSKVEQLVQQARHPSHSPPRTANQLEQRNTGREAMIARAGVRATSSSKAPSHRHHDGTSPQAQWAEKLSTKLPASFHQPANDNGPNIKNGLALLKNRNRARTNSSDGNDASPQKKPMFRGGGRKHSAAAEDFYKGKVLTSGPTYIEESTRVQGQNNQGRVAKTSPSSNRWRPGKALKWLPRSCSSSSPKMARI